jgi:precorrin-6A/cobalt-precorrin-6A reductase
MAMRLLILGGTTEASALARSISGRQDLDPVLSFAGRTRGPVTPPIPFRIGGFGGIEGLKAYLAQREINAVMDATHPFAAQMSRHAVAACRDLGLPLARFSRPEWRPQHGDRWLSVPDMASAARALGFAGRRVFLTVGRLSLAEFAAAPQHHYIIRTIDPADAIAELPSHQLLQARGPFAVADEIDLMRRQRVEVLVTKNSGGAATEPKLAAARALGIEVVMIERPPVEATATFYALEAALAWIEDHRPPP